MPRAVKLGASKKILIVEDSEDFSNLLKFIVDDDGLEGVQFPLQGGDIVSWAKEHKPSVILMDLALRRKTGFEYIDELKADSHTKTIPIIIITGRDLAQRDILDLQMRGVKYFRKGRVGMDDIKNEIHLAMKSKAPAEHAAAKE